MSRDAVDEYEHRCRAVAPRNAALELEASGALPRHQNTPIARGPLSCDSGRMNKLTFAFVTLVATITFAGCAPDSKEDTGTAEEQLIGWLVSPPDFDEENLVGTWMPHHPDEFTSAPSKLEFSADARYRVAGARAGKWDLMKHPIATSIVGTHVNLHPTRSASGVGREEGSLFVARHPSGEIRLVDVSSCFLFVCKNVWRRTPTLTVDEL
jgi:hypothetical protein